MSSTLPEQQIREATSEDRRKRLRLRVMAKLMIYLGAAAVVFIIASAIMSGDGEVPNVPTMRVDISQLESGKVEFLTWEGRPVLVYRRTDADVVNLRTADSRLRDPDSLKSEQPVFAKNDTRSADLELFVAIALGTGQGCTVELMSGMDEIFQGKPWQGGFMDSCGKDRYDLAGRVYDRQYASENLRVPQYTIEGSVVVLGK